MRELLGPIQESLLQRRRKRDCPLLKKKEKVRVP